MKQGIVFDIARFSLNDGPGIRSVVFLKGCPLRCVWCHNPESLTGEPELLYSPERCISCGKCRKVCSAIDDRAHCSGCGKCASVCVAGARRIAGRRMSVKEVWDELEKDLLYYGENGGVTLSGGEPLFQVDFALELAKKIFGEGISLCIETCGYAAWETIEKFLPYVSCWLYDIKSVSAQKHKLLTGISNEVILDNLHRLDQKGACIELRCPLVPGLNDSPADLNAILLLAKKLKNCRKIHPEPYHPFGLDKWTELGKTPPVRPEIPTPEQIQFYHDFFFTS